LKRDSVLFPAAFGPSFSEIVAEAPLQLGLLNSENRDEHTARSFEVPASGGLLLAEDTPEHRDIFKSESNALFFKTTAQLLNQIDWVIANPAGAREIANAGYELITNGSNSWADRANEILTCILDKSNSIYESKRF
jgi:spore maturation protein CgeB